MACNPPAEVMVFSRPFRVFFKTGKNEDALAAYLQAVKHDPGFAKAWYNLSLVYHNLKKHDEETKARAQASHLDPSYK